MDYLERKGKGRPVPLLLAEGKKKQGASFVTEIDLQCGGEGKIDLRNGGGGETEGVQRGAASGPTQY